MRGNLFCFLDFYLVGILKNFPGEKTKGNEEPEPMRKTKKQKRKRLKKHQGGGRRDFWLFLRLCFGLICFCKQIKVVKKTSP